MMDSDDSDQDVGAYQSSDDEDYVPEGASADDDDDEDYRSKGSNKKTGRTPRKKPVTSARRSSLRRGVKRSMREPDTDEESDEPLATSESEDDPNDEEDHEEAEDEENGEEDKKRINDIWESMKKDGKPAQKTDRDEKSEDGNSEKETENEKNEESEQNEENLKEKEEPMVKETLEAQTEKQGETQKQEKTTIDTPGNAGKKRPGGLQSIVGSIGKKQKLSTLEKSKKDWEAFKKEEGIEDELKNKSKDGYLSKQEFLQRVDYRTWENEREMRLATGRGNK